MYERLTKYAGALADRETETIPFCGTAGMDDFIEDFYALEGFGDTDYFDTLRRYGVDETTGDDFEGCDVGRADLELARALVTYCVRKDRFCAGALGGFARSGFLDRCLLRIKELDEG